MYQKISKPNSNQYNHFLSFDRSVILQDNSINNIIISLKLIRD